MATETALQLARRIDWRGATDRRLLRGAMRYLREELQVHFHPHQLECSARGVYFSARQEANDVIDFLLEIEAIDLIGVAELLRDRDEKTIRQRRRRNRRRVTGHDLQQSLPFR